MALIERSPRFCMSRTEVTAREAGNNASATTRIPDGGVRGSGRLCNAARANRSDHPANCIDWLAARVWCRAHGGDLPTKTQWLLAARGAGPTAAFPWGNEALSAAHLNAFGPECQRAWHSDRVLCEGDEGAADTAPVGSFPRGDTAGGVHDLAGNVSEWTVGPGDSAVARGSSWSSRTVDEVNVHARIEHDGATRLVTLGFRCVTRPQEKWTMKIMTMMACVLVALGCGSTSGTARGMTGSLGRMLGLTAVCEEMSASEPELRLMVQAVTRAGGQTRTLRNGDTLRSGDQFHLKVCLNHGARLYLLQARASGVEMLRPTGRQGEMVEPRAAVCVPDVGYDIRLDDEVGEEPLVIIASDRPIEESDPRIGEALARLRARATPTAARFSPLTTRRASRERLDFSALAAFNPRGMPRSLSIEPSADDGAELTEVVDSLVVWRLDLRHEP